MELCASRRLRSWMVGIVVALGISMTARALIVEEFHAFHGPTPPPGSLPAGPPAEFRRNTTHEDLILGITYREGFSGEVLRRLIVVSGRSRKPISIPDLPGQECATEIVAADPRAADAINKTLQGFRANVLSNFDHAEDVAACSIERSDGSRETLTCPDGALVDRLLRDVRDTAGAGAGHAR